MKSYISPNYSVLRAIDADEWIFKSKEKTLRITSQRLSAFGFRFDMELNDETIQQIINHIWDYEREFTVKVPGVTINVPKEEDLGWGFD